MSNKIIVFMLAVMLVFCGCNGRRKGMLQRLNRPYEDNPEMQERVRKLIGISIELPADMRSSKQGKNFLWISNNATAGRKNMAIYKVTTADTLPLSVERFCQLRDSVMKINIKGETDSMFITTLKASIEGRFNAKTRRCRYEGLWEMQGDAMGGPFVCNVYKCPEEGELIFAEGFLYAPEISNKKTLLSQLHAILGSINIKNNNGK